LTRLPGRRARDLPKCTRDGHGNRPLPQSSDVRVGGDVLDSHPHQQHARNAVAHPELPRRSTRVAAPGDEPGCSRGCRGSARATVGAVNRARRSERPTIRTPNRGHRAPLRGGELVNRGRRAVRPPGPHSPSGPLRASAGHPRARPKAGGKSAAHARLHFDTFAWWLAEDADRAARNCCRCSMRSPSPAPNRPSAPAARADSRRQGLLDPSPRAVLRARGIGFTSHEAADQIA
jgi:hypothetical protein